MDEARATAIRQYVVLHLKLIELLHLMLLSFHLSEPGACPPNNELNHGADRFRETLLGAIVNTFMSLSDNPKSTDVRTIWKRLYPKHARAIDRVWERQIAPGESVMKEYRNRAGAHGDRPERYFAAKAGLYNKHEEVLAAMGAFLRLSVRLDKKQAKELPELYEDLESVIFDIELGLQGGGYFSRKWLKQMHLVPSGNYKRVFN